MNCSLIDKWLLHNGDYSQEERETIMRFLDDYFNKGLVVTDGKEKIVPLQVIGTMQKSS